MPARASEAFDLVLVGTGFASSFFLAEYLARAPASARVGVFEKGVHRDHAWQIAGGAARLRQESARHFAYRDDRKEWWLTIALGGGSNCWWGCTPRLLPNDFRLRTTYGVGRDWPLSYDELEPYYARAEEAMQIAGPAESPFPRSTAYPQPPHRLSDPDRLLQRAWPGAFFAMPAARPSRATPSGRPRCCASGVCGACPVDSKFTVLNEMMALYRDPRVELVTGASVQAVETRGGTATGVRLRRKDGSEQGVRGELVVLGANAVFNPHILLRSGLEHPQLGRRLFEQGGVRAAVLLDGVDAFQGSTSLTGHGYMLYDGEHRAKRSAVLLETSNVPELRPERGRWRQVLRVKCILEDLPNAANRVVVDPEAPERPRIEFAGRSVYAERARKRLLEDLARVVAPLPVEEIRMQPRYDPTEAHALGTCAMGDDPADSVVDRGLVHHSVRNLLVLGGSAFPVGSPANPTLTIAALSLWAADGLLGSRSAA